MFIQTENTPNPNSIKFIPDGHNISRDGNFEFTNKEEAKEKSILAYELLKIDGVSSIFFGLDFITVNKLDTKDWKNIKTNILTTIMDYISSNQPIINDSYNKKEYIDKTEEDNEIVKQIKELIEIKIRPAVAMDGGDITYRDFIDGVVYLELKGACSGCPSASITLKNGIENMLKHYIPEVKSVEESYQN